MKPTIALRIANNLPKGSKHWTPQTRQLLLELLTDTYDGELLNAALWIEFVEAVYGVGYTDGLIGLAEGY
jgi:hypothetical protein